MTDDEGTVLYIDQVSGVTFRIPNEPTDQDLQGARDAFLVALLRLVAIRWRTKGMVGLSLYGLAGEALDDLRETLRRLGERRP